MNALTPASGKSYQLVLSVPEIAALWHLPSRECRIGGIEWSAHADVPLPVILDKVGEGVRLGTSTFQNRTATIRLPDKDRNTHVNLIGRTRMGKSTLMHNMIRQDIAAGHGVTVIDPHGDLVEDILYQSIPAGREEDVVLFDLDENRRTIGLNLLTPTGHTEISTEAALTIAVLSKFFGEDLGGGRTGDTLNAAIMSLMYQPGSTLLDVPRLFSDSAFRRQVLDHVDDPVVLNYWRYEFESASPGQQRELALPINHRMRSLYREVRLRRLIGSSACLDFDAILAKSRVLLVNLRGSQTGTGRALGALVLSKIQMAAMGSESIPRERRRLHYLYVDEVQNYATSSLDTILSEAAKYGLHLTIANQFLSQLEGKTLKAVLGNVGTNIIFRCSEDDVDVMTPIVRPNYDSYDLRNMNRYQAIVKTQVDGETLPAFVVRTDPPPPDHEEGPTRAHRIREMSRNRYGTPVEEIDAMIRNRYADNEPTVEEAFDPQNPNYFG